MQTMLILGGGTAGTMLANKLVAESEDWAVTVVDRDDRHVYQPGLLFLPFGDAGARRIERSRRKQLDNRVDLVIGEVDRIETDLHRVLLADGWELRYDTLVIASGTSPRPDQTEGMRGPAWRRSIFDFYTLDGARALRGALDRFTGGRLVVHVAETPIKCPVAPLEFTFLADAMLRRRGRRAATSITYVTPLDGAFTRPVAADRLAGMLAERDIALETDFVIERVDPDARTLVSYDGREVPFDLLVTVPVNMGADFVARSGLGDELNHVPVDPHTFAARGVEDVYAIGDAADVPTSKAGSVAHFEVESFVHDLVARRNGIPPASDFDGHANCFVESGDHRAILLDFNYDVEPLPGLFPLPYVGPLRLLQESRLNHLGKRAFAWVYWHLLLPGRRLPVPRLMSQRGKFRPAPPPQAQPPALAGLGAAPRTPPNPSNQEDRS